MRTLVWAPRRAYSSLVSNHLVINNKIEWIRVVADTNKGIKIKKKKRAGSFDHFYSVMPDTNAKTRRHIDLHSLTCTHTQTNTCTYMRSF